MLQDRRPFGPVQKEEQQAPFISTSSQPYDLLVGYTSGGRKWEVRGYAQEEHEEFDVTISSPLNGAGQIVFLRGFLSPSWVSAVGSKYNIDPEFFRSHMDFLSTGVSGHAYSLSSLQSCSSNIFRLCVSTVLHRDDFGGQDLQMQRSTQSVDMGTYKIQQLGSTRMCCGDSIAREYSTICTNYSVLEQWISICVAKVESGWTGKTLPIYTRPLTD